MAHDRTIPEEMRATIAAMPALELDAVPPELSEEAIALTFAARHADDLRFCAAWGRWLEWTGTRWKQDDTLLAFDRARLICRAISTTTDKPNVASAIASAKTVAAIERLARADRRLAATTDQWDADPWALNTPGGTIDLRTGRTERHRREDHITKTTAIAPGGPCPRWLAFLNDIMAGDQALIGFLQRMAGYACTGSTREHALFFAYGTGSNGKSVLINTLTGILGDYAVTAPMECFIATNSNRHPTDLAGLRGARLVTAIETEEGRQWAENKIKALTGGDRIAARFMRQDFFEFVPEFKLLVAGNHRPGLRSVDEAIRRRMNLVPFTVTIPATMRDQKLAERLRAEWPGILAWMIEGCLEWQRQGLARPAAVRNATDAYLAAEDSIAEWIAERCTTAPNDTASSSALFKSWAKWAAAAGEVVSSQKQFSQALEDRGFVKKHANTGARFQGIALVPEPQPDAPYWHRDR